MRKPVSNCTNAGVENHIVPKICPRKGVLEEFFNVLRAADGSVRNQCAIVSSIVAADATPCLPSGLR